MPSSFPPPPVRCATAVTRSSSSSCCCSSQQQQEEQQQRRDNSYCPPKMAPPPPPPLQLALCDIVRMSLEAGQGAGRDSSRDHDTITTHTATPVPITPDSSRTTVRMQRLEPPLLLPRRKPIQLYHHSTSNTITNKNQHGKDEKNTEDDSRLLPFLPMTLHDPYPATATTTTTTTSSITKPTPPPPPPFVLQPRPSALPPLVLMLLEEDRLMFRPRPRIVPYRPPQPKQQQQPLPSLLPIKRSREVYYIETTTTRATSSSIVDDDAYFLPLLPEQTTTVHHEWLKPRFSSRTNPFREDRSSG